MKVNKTSLMELYRLLVSYQTRQIRLFRFRQSPEATGFRLRIVTKDNRHYASSENDVTSISRAILLLQQLRYSRPILEENFNVDRMKRRLKNLIGNNDNDNRADGSGDATVVDDVVDELADDNEDWIYLDIFFDNLSSADARKLIGVLDDEAFNENDLLTTTQISMYGAPDIARYGRGINSDSRVNNLLNIRDYETHEREQPYISAGAALPLDARLRHTLNDISNLTGRSFRF